MRALKKAASLAVGIVVVCADYVVLCGGLAILAGITAVYFGLFGLGWLAGAMVDAVTSGFARGDAHPDDGLKLLERGIKGFHKIARDLLADKLGSAWRMTPKGDA